MSGRCLPSFLERVAVDQPAKGWGGERRAREARLDLRPGQVLDDEDKPAAAVVKGRHGRPGGQWMGG
jgi:hypothetical protein